MSTAPGPSAAPDPRRWRALAVLAAVQLVLILDATAVNVALPSLRSGLGFTEIGLAWVVNGYVLTFGGLLLLGGRLADLVGRRRAAPAPWARGRLLRRSPVPADRPPRHGADEPSGLRRASAGKPPGCALGSGPLDA